MKNWNKNLWIVGLLAAMLLQSGCGSKPSEPPADEPASPAVEEPASGEATHDQVAKPSEMTTIDKVVEAGMEPIPADLLKDGTYDIAVDSSSQMFKIVHCTLTVDGNHMTAVMTMSGKGYTKIFMGTGEEAVAASEEDYIPFAEDAQGNHTFTVEVEALNASIDCTAFSKNKEKWYDRTLVFRADSLPLEALDDSLVTLPKELNLADGEYTVDVALKGGSGRASITSPAALHVANGTATATIIWSSSHYDYMKIGETIYEPVTTDPTSTFELPLSAFDWPIAVIADTIAMSESHEISYTLTFDSTTVQPAG